MISAVTPGGETWYGGWGASPIIRDITVDLETIELKWIDTNYPVEYCEWVHFGVHLKPGAYTFGGFANWTQITSYPYLKACSPITLEDGNCTVGIQDIYWGFRYDGVWHPADPNDMYDGNTVAGGEYGRLWYTYTKPIHFNETCKHELFYWAKDLFGQQSPVYRQEYYVDDVAPDIYKKHPDHGYYGGTTRILWDDTHDLNGDELIDPAGNYHDLYKFLISLGYSVDELDIGPITGHKLEGYHILVLPDSEAELTASEIAAIQQWVSMGGRLFVMGDAPENFHHESVDTLLDPYGIGYTMDDILEYNNWTDFEPHEITDGISNVVGQWPVGPA